MILPLFPDNPFQIKLSFHKVIERLEEIAENGSNLEALSAQDLLHEIAPFPEFRDGITEAIQVENNALLISRLLADLFPPALTLNEIKAVSIPFLGLVFNYSQRFLNILKAAGTEFQFNIRDFDDHQFYVMSCCIILNQYYGTHLDFSKPLFYDIPDADGVMRHYRILYNADFLDILPKEDAPKLTPDDIDRLMDNYDDLALWKEKFPPGSWILKGFALLTLIDVTVENALSNLKSNLIGTAPDPDLHQKLESIFRSIFKIPDIRIGFSSFSQEEGKLSNSGFVSKFQSFLLDGQADTDCEKIFLSKTYKTLIKEQEYIAVSDVSERLLEHPDSLVAMHFKRQNIESFILAPVVKNGHLLGILELVSHRKRELNSVNALKLDIVMPFLVDTIDRKVNETQNQIQAVIQNNYTTLHPSVHWKFKHEALKYIQAKNVGQEYALKEIVLNDVYPLYGQVDIKDSSITRNSSVSNDISYQLQQTILLLEQIDQSNPFSFSEQILPDLKEYAFELSTGVKADSEQNIQNYLHTTVFPVLNKPGYNATIKKSITDYFKNIDQLTGDFYTYRRNYETTLSLVNEKLLDILDSRQQEIQQYFPHYYERFKTDGVEHNLYIGSAISPKQNFTMADLHRLRLWQLRVIAEMEAEQYSLKATLPYHLGVTSLILVFSIPIAIRFRMDEKHFDIDGAYNIRYEVIKKRIDKAHIKDTFKRITEQGKLTIIYSKTEEEQEYRAYIRILQSANVLADDIEQFDVEDLQGVSGLKALRVSVLHEQSKPTKESYNELYKQLDESVQLSS